jgi:signal transduction histidine kinase
MAVATLPPTMPRRAQLAIPAALAALGLAACGGGDDEAATAPAPAPAPTTSEPTGPTVVGGGPTELRLRFEDRIRSALAAQERDGLVDVDCVLKRLRATVSDDLVATAERAVARGEEIPERAVDAAFAAGRDCPGG